MVTCKVRPNISKVPTVPSCRIHHVACGWGIQAHRRLSLPSECWDLRHEPPCLASSLLISGFVGLLIPETVLATFPSSTQCTPAQAVKHCCIYCPPFVPLTKVCAFAVPLLLCHSDFTMAMSCFCTRCTLWIVCRLIHSPQALWGS